MFYPLLCKQRGVIDNTSLVVRISVANHNALHCSDGKVYSGKATRLNLRRFKQLWILQNFTLFYPAFVKVEYIWLIFFFIKGMIVIQIDSNKYYCCYIVLKIQNYISLQYSYFLKIILSLNFCNQHLIFRGKHYKG